PFLSQLMNFLMYLGSIKLERDKRGFNRMIVLRIYSIVLIITQPLIEYFYSMPSLLFVGFIFSLIASIFSYIAFFLVGISNRAHYGNYLISAAVLSITSGITNWTNIFIGGVEIVFGLQYGFFFTSAMFLSGILGLTYFLFFGIRIRSYYFIFNSLLSLVFSFYIFILTPFVILLIVYIPVVLGIIISSKFFELGKRFRKGFRVFITHAVDDFKRYRIDDLAKFLESQKEVGRVFYCEMDLTGNIDQWMNKTVPRCQLLIFFSTEKSLDSADCITELNLARKNNLLIVPILGVGLNWETLKKLEMDRDFGTAYNPMEFEMFCSEVYQHVLKYKEFLASQTPEKKMKNKE
ncbi:MAG: hypothetical protein ACFE96_12955, partial [Candidatus Hermodarchaeota archaeon]